jgi:hypothetical protein
MLNATHEPLIQEAQELRLILSTIIRNNAANELRHRTPSNR